MKSAWRWTRWRRDERRGLHDGARGHTVARRRLRINITSVVFGAVGILAALREREHTGRGQLVESALFEKSAFYTGQHMTYFARTGEAAKPMPACSHVFAVYDLFKTQDNDVFLAMASEQRGERFCAEFGFAELMADLALTTQSDRLQSRTDVTAAIAACFVQMRSDGIVERCAAATLPVANVNRLDQMLDDRHLLESGESLDVEMADWRHARVPALPFKMDGRTLGVRQQSPSAGAQTQDFLRTCGVDAAAVDALAEAGVVTKPNTAGAMASAICQASSTSAMKARATASRSSPARSAGKTRSC